MGAVTAILYANENPNTLEAIILDSPFADLKQVVIHLVKSRQKYIPNFILKGLLLIVRSTIKKKANFDINNIEPLKCVENLKIPAYILFSFADEFIPYGQFEDILRGYGGEKQYEIIDGSHNGIRNLEVCQRIGAFLHKHLKDEIKYHHDNISSNIAPNEVKDLSEN